MDITIASTVYISVNSTLSHLQTKEIVICCWNAIIYQTVKREKKNTIKMYLYGIAQAKQTHTHTHTLYNDRETKWF